MPELAKQSWSLGVCIFHSEFLRSPLALIRHGQDVLREFELVAILWEANHPQEGLQCRQLQNLEMDDAILRISLARRGIQRTTSSKNG